MDANNRESAGDAGMAAGSSGAVARMKRNIAERVGSAKSAAASGLERTASSLHSGADQTSNFGHSAVNQVSEVGHSAAHHIHATADYMRDAELEGIATEVRDLLRRYPAQLLFGAALLGFILGRGLSRLR